MIKLPPYAGNLKILKLVDKNGNVIPTSHLTEPKPDTEMTQRATESGRSFRKAFCNE